MKDANRTFDIRDVARLAGVSVGSTSRAINGGRHVSAEVKAKVDRAVSALAYKPNHSARALRSKLSKTIGFLVPDMGNPLYAEILGVLEEELRRNGYMLLLASSGNDAQREIESLEMFSQRGVDGVIVVPGNEKDQRLNAAIDELAVPTVIFDRKLLSEHDSLQIDANAGIGEAMQRLFQLGHRRIGLVLAKGDRHPARSRLASYQEAYRTVGLVAPTDLVLQVDSVSANSGAEIAELLALKERPTALIVPGTRILYAALRAITESSMKIPDDVSLISAGDTDFAREHEPKLSVLALDIKGAASRIAQLLLTRLQDRDVPPREDHLPLFFIDRQSVGAVQKR